MKLREVIQLLLCCVLQGVLFELDEVITRRGAFFFKKKAFPNRGKARRFKEVVVVHSYYISISSDNH